MNSSSNVPEAFKNAGPLPFSYNQQRSKFLLTVLRGASVLGFFVVIFYVGTTTPMLAAIIITAYVALLTATIVSFPYPIRAGILLLITFVLGVSALLEAGIYGDSRLFFLTFALLTAMLFDRREYFIAIALSIIATATVGWLLSTGILTLTTSEVTNGSLSTWIVETLMLILIATVFEEGWKQLRQEFNVSQETLQSAMKSLNDERTHLEDRVTERTAELRDATELSQLRVRRLHAVSELAHTVALIQDAGKLLPTLAQLISENFGIYHVGIFLTEKTNEYVVLSATNSEGGQRMLASGYKINVGQAGMVGYVAATKQPRIALKDDSGKILFDNPDLPNTRSEMALPLAIGQRVIGVLDLHSDQESAFGEEDIEIMNTLAAQVSIAIENARLFNETRDALAEAKAVYGTSVRQSWGRIPMEARNTGYRYADAHINQIKERLDLPEIHSAIKSGQSVIPNEKNSALAVPLRLRDEVIGVLDVRSGNNTHKLSENEIALIQAVAERITLALENARLLQDAQQRATKERTISAITSKIGASVNIKNILQTAVEEIGHIIPGSEVILQLQQKSDDVQNLPEGNGS